MRQLAKKQKAEIVTYKPIQDIEIVFSNEVTPKHIIEANKPSIAKIERRIGKENLVKTIALALTKSIALSGVPALTNDQLQFIAREIKNSWRNLSIADVCLCLKNGSIGKYGQFYGRIGIDTIVGENGWFSKYAMDRVADFESKIYEKKEQDQKELGMSFQEWKTKYPEKYKARLDKIRNIGKKKFENKYRSIEHYCKVNEIDFEEYKKEQMNNWENWYENEKPEKPKEVFFAQCEMLHIAELNGK